ncbi:glycerophosphodiester phosphodiesterase [Salipaludibacillus agaradhaerens]|uniref:Glycerophosphodiester phosphodiesterase n=1 Tax=Salipaludibacillus agaradhaerens TaxID=76935 RepID=A0A9Q4G0T5_SALAG|nr:glycerophosphodiester phosphodiesterase [Salipaludibacillus agaradhaerens]MCR6098223.1 glycerophosphodiester phosphodiesterase [Salipaludibacillus agaradhaerens]MCR6116147.1 glycerophosphodiester phosphodiesterase [Salipaludibacillus agaradhaerens]
MTQQTLIFAHRGASGTYPENTMDAYKAAAEAGADGLEVDVQLSKDGVPVLIHDETVNRTTNGEGWVKDLTYEELQTMDAGSWFHDDFSHATIPSLEELLIWLRGQSLYLNIELKTGIVHYPGIENAVIKLIKQYDLIDRVILSSFNHYSLVTVRQLHPTIETAILFMEGLYEPWDYAKTVGAQSLHCSLPVAVPKLLMAAAEADTPVRPFTVNERSHMKALFQAKCAAIMTDWPEQALQVREEITKTS